MDTSYIQQLIANGQYHINYIILFYDAPSPPLNNLFQLSIPPLPRNNPSHPTLWIIHIPLIPRNHMQVQVHHALPGRRPDVHTDIVAVGGIVLTGLRSYRAKGEMSWRGVGWSGVGKNE